MLSRLIDRNDGGRERLLKRRALLYRAATIDRTEEIMRTILRRLAGAAGAGADVRSCARRRARSRSPSAAAPACAICRPCWRRQLGEYEKAGLAVELVDLKGGSDALKAVLGGSADVVSGYFDHCVNLAAKKQELQSFVVYDRYPGLVLVVSPDAQRRDQVDQGSRRQEGRRQRARLLDRLLPQISPEEERRRSGERRRDRRRPRRHRGGGDAAGPDRCGRDARSGGHRAAGQLSGSAILSDTRTQKDTLDVFGGEYPGGALYTTADWIKSHEKEAQALTNAIVEHADWIHSHSPEEIMAKMPPEIVGKDKALYLAALKNTLPMYSKTGMMDPEGRGRGARGVQRGVARGRESQDRPVKTYTNKFVEQARKTTGMNAK